ncbi:hypothetical protein ACFV80_18655 [Streptomyces sp. NPDC059862]|uniref:hypothetical protein n=1 Tax=Streptomyces sp. NPDC059862 TaxID=3346975 RepID=UPI003648B8E0
MAHRGGRARVRLPVLVSVSVALALWGGPATVAAAPGPGGDIPDLAVVIAGGSGRTTALRSGEPEFARLWQLLEPTFAGTERVSDGWAEGRYPPVRITVIWGLTGVGGWPQSNRPPGGDVAVQRQDQLFVTEDGTPWVRSDPSPDVEDDDIRWHRAPRSVFERLDGARLLGGQDGTGAAGPGARAGRASGAWWAIPGLVVGLALGAGGTLLIRRAAARPMAGPPRAEPRQELIDL